MGPVLAAWLLYSLYKQVRSQPDLPNAIALIRDVPFGPGAWKFWLVVVLSMVNWGIEARKWQLLMRTLEPMNFFKAFRAVLSGVTVSLNMPNRIGEYGGRIIYVQEGKRIRAVSLSIAGGIAQLIVTLAMGCAGLVFMLRQLDYPGATLFGLSVFWLQIWLYLSVCALLVLLLFFFKLSWLIRMIEKIPYSHKFVHHISVLDSFDVKVLLRLLFLSALRYIVFVLQYIFMLQLMQVEVGWWQSCWVVSVMFWMLAIIPGFAIADLPIRGQISKSLFSLFSSNLAGILAVTFGIWFINLFIPAVAGSLLILGSKFFKEK